MSVSSLRAYVVMAIACGCTSPNPAYKPRNLMDAPQAFEAGEADTAPVLDTAGPDIAGPDAGPLDTALPDLRPICAR